MRTLRFILIFILIVSCKEADRLNNDGNYWHQDDLTELITIVSNYENTLKKVYGTSSEAEAFSKFSTDFVTSIKGKGSFIAPQGLDINISELKVFDKIWKKYSNPDLDSYSVNLYFPSPYFNYLKSISKNSTVIENYIKRFEKSSDLTPTTIFYFAENAQNFDYSDVNYRLIVAIHYLTLTNR